MACLSVMLICNMKTMCILKGCFFITGNFYLSVIQTTTLVLKFPPILHNGILYPSPWCWAKMRIAIIAYATSRLLGRRFILNKPQVFLEGKERMFFCTPIFKKTQGLWKFTSCVLLSLLSPTLIPRCGGQNGPRQRCPHLNPWNLWICCLTWHKGLCRCN